MVPLLMVRKSTRLTKSNKVINGPPSVRIFTKWSTAPSPTPRMPPSPKRMAPWVLTANGKMDSLTSGPNTGMRMRRASSMKKVTCLMSSMLLVSTAAMYSAG